MGFGTDICTFGKFGLIGVVSKFSPPKPDEGAAAGVTTNSQAFLAVLDTCIDGFIGHTASPCQWPICPQVLQRETALVSLINRLRLAAKFTSILGTFPSFDELAGYADE